MPNHRDLSVVTAYPKSGLTFLNYLIFHIVFCQNADRRKIAAEYIIDVHLYGGDLPESATNPKYVKSHFPYNPILPIYTRASRAILLMRDPIDVMMSMWDYRHLTGELPATRLHDETGLEDYIDAWIQTGGLVFPWAGSWVNHVTSWLDQTEIPVLPVSYESLKAAPFVQLRRIAQFLGVTVTDAQIEHAVEASSVENMRQDQDQIVAAQKKDGSFFGSSFAKPYEMGYRFIGRLHSGSKMTALNETQRALAEERFGDIWRRALEMTATER